MSYEDMMDEHAALAHEISNRDLHVEELEKRIEGLEAELAAESEQINDLQKEIEYRRVARRTELLEFIAGKERIEEMKALIDRVVAWDNHAGKESIIEIARDMRKHREEDDVRKKRHGE